MTPIIWFTGQPGSGKTTLADRLDGCRIDGDDLRRLDNPGYDTAGRRTNIDRAQAIAAYLYDHGQPVVVSLVSPYRDQRESFKTRFPVVEIYLHTTIDRGRGAYHVADYEPPVEDYVDIDTGHTTIAAALRTIHRAVATPPPRP